MVLLLYILILSKVPSFVRIAEQGPVRAGKPNLGGSSFRYLRQFKLFSTL
ncbi:hypothetical protein GCM10007063_24580 [Lentibacillus kapialis]|uniref:Uncharacterized protein n=1 Tax=Lentibacillus kapialis TaxID=340214 RepID=A0A917PYL5_9BACI|nr:hypothetical protein GCM10007063_24580 [Lentibacillus kapialis]